MNRAIAESCDIYFYVMGIRVGIQPIADMARRFGLGERFSGLPVPYQYYGTVPDPAWKRRRYNEPWEAYDTVNATIGQGYLLANPLQLAVMTARLAAGEKTHPKLLAAKVAPAAPLGIDPRMLAIVRQGMEDVVNVSSIFTLGFEYISRGDDIGFARSPGEDRFSLGFANAAPEMDLHTKRLCLLEEPILEALHRSAALNEIIEWAAR